MSSINNNNQKEIFPNENNNTNPIRKHSSDETENKLSSELDELIIDNNKSPILNDKSKPANYGKILDNIINKLYPIIETRKNKFDDSDSPQELNPAVSQKNQLTQDEIKFLCTKSLEIFMEEPVLLEVPAPVNICGDTHGQFNDLLRLFEFGGRPPNTNYLFLGDYVDRGYNSIETILYFMLLKILYPDRITLLRGNHECQQITMQYGFYDECRRKYNSINVWRYCCEVFNHLPIAALIENRIFVVHGGLSPKLENLDDLTKLERYKEIEHEGLITDILWSDPEADIEGFKISPRGAGFLFGGDAVEKFLDTNKLDCVVRAHQLIMEGYKIMFDNRLITVWSAPNYCYRCGNVASIMEVDEDLEKDFKVFEATTNEEKQVPIIKDLPEYFL